MAFPGKRTGSLDDDKNLLVAGGQVFSIARARRTGSRTRGFRRIGDSGARVLREVLGLVIRRQAWSWKGLRPWLVLIGLVHPLGVLLSLTVQPVADRDVMYPWNWIALGQVAFWRFSRYYTPYITLICSSLSSGFMLGAVSRKTRINGILFCLALFLETLLFVPRHHWFEQWIRRGLVFPLFIRTFLVLVPSLLGVQWGFEIARFPLILRMGLWIAAIATVLRIIFFNPILLAWQPQLRLIVYWPIAFIVATAIGRRWQARLPQRLEAAMAKDRRVL